MYSIYKASAVRGSRVLAMDKLQVKRLTTPEEVLQATGKRVSGNYRPGEQDHRIIFELDPNGFYSALLEPETEVVGCMCILRHSEKFAFIGYYFISEEYRGRGFGTLMWRQVLAMASLPPDCNIGLVSSTAQRARYEKMGFKESWEILNTDIIASEALLTMTQMQSSSSSNTRILPISRDNFEDILNYDAQVYSFPRRSFLEKWLFASNCHAFLAQEERGKVVGYVVVRKTVNQKEGWKIGPLFANDSETGVKLYRASFDAVTATHKSPVVRIAAPHANKAAIQIARTIASGTERGENFVRMYTAGIPPGTQVDKIYVHTAVEFY